MLKTLFAALTLSVFALNAHADESAVKKAVEALVGEKVDSVRKSGVLGLYEVNLGGELIYTDEKVNYLISGEIIDAKTKKNITQERLAKLMTINFSELPLDQAVKIVRGSGKRVLATFEDPNCGYCKRLAKELLAMNDVTIYTFLYPILSPDSIEKSKAIWCASDRAKAWTDWMVNNVAPTAAATCTTPIEKVVALGQKLNIRGTPTIFFTNGERIPGAVPIAQIEKSLDASSKKN